MKAAYCMRHAENDMVDVRENMLCSHVSCASAPTFSSDRRKKATYCELHAKDGMVDVRVRRCSHDACLNKPSFNVKGSKQPAYCRKHAENNMINVLVDRCSHGSCKNAAIWGGLSDRAATVCARHKTDLSGASVVRFNTTCKVAGCGKYSQWGLDGEQPTHCLVHGPHEEGLVRTIGTDGSKSLSRSPSYHAVKGQSFYVKTECRF